MCALNKEEILELEDGEEFRMKDVATGEIVIATKIAQDSSFMEIDIPLLGEDGEETYHEIELIDDEGTYLTPNGNTIQYYNMEECCD